MPAPGWDPAARWQGSFPYSSNPRFYDPPTGLIGNTNNKPLDRPFPLHVSFDWGDTMRIQRWVRLMRQRSVHTRESFIEAQLDTVSQAARTLLPLVGAELWFQGAPAEPGTPEAQRQIALQLLADWNGEMSEHLPEPLIYAAYEPSHHSDEAFQMAVRNGVRAHHWPFGNMPPIEGLTRADVQYIVRYVREVQRENGIN